MDGEVVVYVSALLGVAARIILPWLMIRLDEGTEWDWRKAAGQLVASLIAFVTLVAANPDLPNLTWQGALAIGLTAAAGGWGVADIGRTAQKAKK